MTNSNNSIVNILVSINKEQLQQVIGQQLPVDLLNHFSPKKLKEIRISVRRKGNIDVTAENNSFKYRVLFELFVQKDTMLVNMDMLFEIYLEFITKFLFKDSWELATRTQITGYQWIKKPELDLGIFNISLENTVLKAIQSNKEILCKKVDNKIKEIGDIRTKLNQILSILPNPIPTPSDEQVWWQCKMIKTSISPLFEKDGFIYIKTALEANTEFSFGKPLEKLTTVIKAPDIVPDIEKESHLQTLLSITFKTVEKSAMRWLQKQSFELKGRKIQIVAVRIKQARQRLKITINLEGSFEGEIILVGKPVFDSSKNEIQIKEIELQEIAMFSVDITKTLISTKGNEDRINVKNIFDNEINRLIIKSDEFRLKQILLNYLSNSVKFTRSGFINIRSEIIEIENDSNCKVKITVAD